MLEYQRRGAKWENVKSVSTQILQTDFIETVLNYTLTAINALNIPEFVDWVVNNKINGVGITPVFREDYMSVDALPPDLLLPLVDQLKHKLLSYKSDNDEWTRTTAVKLVETFLQILSNATYRPEYVRKLRYKTLAEDRASAKPFLEVVPQWKPYFDAVKPSWVK